MHHWEEPIAPPPPGFTTSMRTIAYSNDWGCHGDQDAKEAEAESYLDIKKELRESQTHRAWFQTVAYILIATLVN